MKVYVELPLKELLEECCDNKDNINRIYKIIRDSSRKTMSQTCKYKKFMDDMCSRVACYNDGKNIIGYMKPSYKEFLDKLAVDLNLPLEYENNNYKLLSRLETLRNITQDYELYVEFPSLYNNFKNGRKYIKDVNDNKKRIEEELKHEGNLDKRLELTKEMNVLLNKEHYYYSCGMRSTLNKYLKYQTQLYSRLVHNRKKIKKIYESKSYNRLFNKYLNTDKLYKYIISKYLEVIENTNDIKEKDKYIKLVSLYENKKVAPFELVTKARNSNDLDWILIKHDDEIERIYSDSSNEVKVTVEEKNKLQEIGSKKDLFYENSDYLIKIAGLKKYSGYIGYVYPNGLLVLDKRDNESIPTTPSRDAIYVMNVRDFQELRTCNKKQLSNSDKVIRITHSDNWQDKINNLIKKDAGDVKTLIKKNNQGF